MKKNKLTKKVSKMKKHFFFLKSGKTDCRTDSENIFTDSFLKLNSLKSILKHTNVEIRILSKEIFG